MQTLDTLGAGFTLASYDMDIRGAGNLLGDEQSGHVREVGVELYQEMLRQAVEAAKPEKLTMMKHLLKLSGHRKSTLALKCAFQKLMCLI